MRYKELVLLFLLATSIAVNAQSEQEIPKVTVGGALRFNYNYSDWKEGSKDRGGDFGFDVFRIDVDAAYKKIILDAEYRFYSKSSGGGMLKSGWLGYAFTPQDEIQIGLTRVPFGITPYNSNSYFFQINYYVGLEDDSDMGIKYTHKDTKWEYSLAFFKNAEELDFGSASPVSDSRYAYDVAGSNKENNQLNGQLYFSFGDQYLKHRLGVSAMVGGLYNIETGRNGNHNAFAIHYELNIKRWDLKLQLASYEKNPENKEDDPRDVVVMTAYGAPYSVAAKANLYTAGLAYTLPVDLGPISSLKFYNDFGWMDKRVKRFKDSFQNVAGCMITAGGVYAYVDYALGKNHAWLGPEWTNAFAYGGDSNSWHGRANINLGYYF